MAGAGAGFPGFTFGASTAGSTGPKLAAAVAPLSAAGSSSTLGGLNLSVPPQPAFGAFTNVAGANDASLAAGFSAAGTAGGTPGASVIAGGPAAAGQSSTIVGLNLSSTTPFSFAPTAAPAGQPTAFGFGAAAAAKTAAPAFGGFSFGGTAATTAAPTAASSAFKSLSGATAPATQSSTIVGLNLSSTTPFSLAAPLSTASSAATTAAWAAAKPAFGSAFGVAPAAAAAPTLGGGFSFGNSVPTAASTSAASAFRGLGGVPGLNLSGSGVCVAGSSGAGVGGFGVGSSGVGGSGGCSSEVKSVLESEIPHEVLATVDAFRRHVASQRELRARMEAERASLLQELGRVAEEAESVAQAARRLATGRAGSVSAAVRLRGDLAELARQLSVARRSFDQPAWQQVESQESLELLGQLVSESAGKIRLLRAEIEDLEAALCLDGSGGRVSGQELLNALRQAREALVACAAELGAASAACDRLRADFLAFRRARGDYRNPFADTAQAAPRAAAGRRSGFGPPPCDDSLAAAATAAANAAASVAAQPAVSVSAPSLFGGGFGGFSSAFSAGAPATSAGAAATPSLFGGFGTGAATAGGTSFGFLSAKRKPD